MCRVGLACAGRWASRGYSLVPAKTGGCRGGASGAGGADSLQGWHVSGGIRDLEAEGRVQCMGFLSDRVPVVAGGHPAAPMCWPHGCNLT